MSNKIRDAIEVLAEKGWVQGIQERKVALGNGEGPWQRPGVCLLGAAYEANWNSLEFDLLDRVIDEQFPHKGYWSIPMFNDANPTKIEDILMVLEKAAIRLDEEV